MDKPTVLIAAGGTGGHVFPALAVANVLRDRDIPVVWVGSESGLENRVVPDAGIPIRTIGVSPLRGGGLFRKPVGLLNLAKAIANSVRIVRQEQAGTVLGMGGYVSGPVCLAAKMTGCRMVVHEQNAVPGFTNRVLKRFATRVLEAIPNTFVGDEKVACTGNPVRRELLSVAPPEERYSERQGPLRILVVGGSQGARALNEIVPAALAQVADPVEVLHQCGARWLEDTSARYQKINVASDVTVEEFIKDMASAYAWADLIVCRSGAMTVAEIAAVGVASVLIPYPSAVDDHQTANGAFLVAANAATLIQEPELTADSLASYIKNIDRESLKAMACRARQISMRDATDRVVAELTGVAA